ncbi:MAG: DUF1559 domain-containing protein, partial [Planctomycetaceae bacterium]
MNHSCPAFVKRGRIRRGVTRIEVVVIIGCVVLLLAILLPWLLQSRSRPGGSRQVQCLDNLRRIGTATEVYARQRDAALPLLEDGPHGWPAALLPSLGHEPVYAELQSDANETAADRRLPVYVCLEDATIDEHAGPLSYVMNGGYGPIHVDLDAGTIDGLENHSIRYDLDGDGEVSEEEPAINLATGAVWRPDESGLRVSFALVQAGDGLAQTILTTENIDARRWASTETIDLAFVLSREGMTFPNGPTGPRALELADVEPGPLAINAALDHPLRLPRPSSLHPGDYVNVLFCDGRGRMVSSQIAPLV